MAEGFFHDEERLRSAAETALVRMANRMEMLEELTGPVVLVFLTEKEAQRLLDANEQFGDDDAMKRTLRQELRDVLEGMHR